MRVTVWHEHRHEHHPDFVKPETSVCYPNGMHGAIQALLQEHLPDRLTQAEARQLHVGTALLDDPEHGLPDDVLNQTDVMTWWAHCAHGDVSDQIADKVKQRVLMGMGLVVLHSAHHSKPFKALMGTGCHLRWREDGQPEKLWCVAPGHPLTVGLDLDPKRPVFEIPQTEVYGEPFDVPTPDEVVFISSFAGGEVFRSVCVWQCGAGKVVYIRPGHETYPIYHQPQVAQLVANAVAYVRPTPGSLARVDGCPKAELPPEG